MKTSRHLNRITQMLLSLVFICASPLAFEAQGSDDQTARLEARSRLVPARRVVTRDYVRQRLDWFRINDPRHAQVFVDFGTLLGTGYDPSLVGAWLDGINDGIVEIGMPSQIVLDYYGEPVFTREVFFEGAPAQLWGFRLMPGRFERVTVAGGRVVGVRA